MFEPACSFKVLFIDQSLLHIYYVYSLIVALNQIVQS